MISVDHSLLLFAVFKVAVNRFLMSKQSCSKLSYSFSSIYSDIFNNLIQYSVSAVSFCAICIFAIKSS